LVTSDDQQATLKLGRDLSYSRRVEYFNKNLRSMVLGIDHCS
jgi:hypothetical protein